MPRQYMTLEKLSQIIGMSKQGVSIPKIVEETGVSFYVVTNYIRSYNRLVNGQEPNKGDHINRVCLEEYIDNERRANEMEKGTKMTAREVEQIMKLKGAGKSDCDIAKELNRSQSTVSMYVTAVRQAIAGTFVHQSTSGVRYELIEPYIRKDGMPGKIEKAITEKEVQKANTPAISGKVDPDNALLIANELEVKTPVDVIARLMRVDVATIGKVRAYIGWLKEKDNDRAVEWKKSGALTEAACAALEDMFGFFPKERTEEEKKKSWQESVTASQELMLDFLDSIESSLRKISGLLEKMVPQE